MASYDWGATTAGNTAASPANTPGDHAACDAEITRLRARAEAAEAKLLEYENAIGWNTSCTSCARVLDSAYAETVRREAAEAKLAAITDACRSIPSPIANRILAITGSEEGGP